MNKIGIITIDKVNNYGAELQAFALQKKLEKLGYDCEIIDYLYYKNWKFKDTNLSKPFAPMSGKEQLAYWLKYRLANFVLDKVFPLFHQATRIRLKRFEKFHRENTKFSRPYHSMIKLYRTPPDYDTYVVGSDQVWNPSASSSIEPYFLTFAPKDAKKISYASSFGVSHIAPELQERFKKLLNNIDVISVRETSGVELVKQLTGRNAELVVDPTLLLNKQEWMPYMQAYPNMPERYVLIYQLSDSDAIVKLAKQIGIEKAIPVYRICKRAFHVKKDTGVINILDAGPAEFLSLIAHAEYVVTNSFHGTAFSVNFHIPFYTVISSRKKNNSRMESLLGTLNLKDRLLYDNNDGTNRQNTSEIIYMPETDSNLNKLRKKSFLFLQENMSESDYK